MKENNELQFDLSKVLTIFRTNMKGYISSYFNRKELSRFLLFIVFFLTYTNTLLSSTLQLELKKITSVYFDETESDPLDSSDNSESGKASEISISDEDYLLTDFSFKYWPYVELLHNEFSKVNDANPFIDKFSIPPILS